MIQRPKKSPLNHAHQVNIFDLRYARKLLLIGAGGVNSWLGVFAVRAGITEIEVWDHDVVKSHNIPMSAYLPKHIGMYKVDALKQIIAELGVEIVIHRERYVGQTALRGGAVACGIDTMKGEEEDGVWIPSGRKTVWENVVLNRVNVDIFTDTRLLGAYVETLAIDPKIEQERKWYNDLLFSDEEAARQTCGNHGIIYATTKAADAALANIMQFWQTGTKKWRYAERCDTLHQVF